MSFNDRGMSMGEFLRRNSGSRAAALGASVCPRCEMVNRFPALGEFLTLSTWEDGKPRRTGSVLIVWEDGRWKSWLNDRDGSLSSWRSAETLVGLLEGIEQALRDDSMEWRRSRQYGGRKGG